MSLSYGATAPDLSDGLDPGIGPTPLTARAWLLALTIFAFALCVYVPMLGDSPISGTEAHRALTAHQMVESGEWLVPRLFGRTYLAKPPLHYWIQAIFEKLSGRATPMVWRLPAAIDGALLAAILCLFGWRWFGEIGGAVSGVAYVGLITMWGEHRGAELDASNTLTATIAALCLIELHFGASRRCAIWILVAGLAAGASFMVKGPASLTILLGVVIFASIDGVRQRGPAGLLRPSIWLPLVIGAAIFGIYALAVSRYLRIHHFATDPTGMQEGLHDAFSLKLSRLRDVSMLAPNLFAYALPMSLAIPLNFIRPLRDSDAWRRRLSNALAWSVLLAWGVCILAGMRLPRYAFVTLPLLCPLAGAIASHVKWLPAVEVKILRNFVTGSGIGYGLAIVGFAVVLGKQHPYLPILLTVVILNLACLLGLIFFLEFRKSWRGAIFILPLIALLAIPFAIWKNEDRIKHSVIPEANLIRETAGPDATLVTCMMVLDQPDLFYFSDLPTRAVNGDMLDWRRLHGPQWVVLEKPELDVWEKKIPGQMSHVTSFVANKNAGWLVLYTPLPPSTSASTSPSTAPGRHRGHGN